MAMSAGEMPVHVAREGEEIPSHPAQYLIGRGGMFMGLKNDWVDAIFPVKAFNALPEVSPKADLMVGKIPTHVYLSALGLFTRVMNELSSEAAVVLLYDEQGEWSIYVPEQEVGPGSVSYQMGPTPRGTKIMGTMHSHVRMGAWHSGTDVHDEAAMDGIHVTIGRVHEFPSVEVAAEVVIRGHRFPKKPTDIFQEGACEVITTQGFWHNSSRGVFTLGGEFPEIPAEVMARIKRRTFAVPIFAPPLPDGQIPPAPLPVSARRRKRGQAPEDTQ